MPKKLARSGPDLISGDHSGFSADIDGRLFPVDRNLLPDPDWSQRTASGGLVGWEPFNYPLPFRGFNIYARPPGAASRSRFRTDNDQLGIIVAEAPEIITVPPGPSILLAPGAPSVYRLDGDLPEWGYEEGFYGAAYSLGRGSYLTAPSPRTILEISALDSGWFNVLDFTANMAAASATAADTLYVLLTTPQATEDDAQEAPLHFQDWFSLVAVSSVSARLSGPWRAGAVAPEANQTAAEDIGPLQFSYKPVNKGRLKAMTLELSWSYRTNTGRALSQMSVNVDVPAQNGAALAAKPPLKPKDAITWQLEWRRAGSGGQWITYGETNDFDSPQYIYSADPIKGTILVDRNVTDSSGIPDPDEEPQAFFDFKDSWVPGNWRISATALYPMPGSALPLERQPLMESGASPDGQIVVGQWDAVRVALRAPGGDQFFNPLGAEREWVPGTPEGIPYGYTFLESTPGDVEDGLIALEDATLATTAEDVLVRERVPISFNPHTLRLEVHFTGHVGGAVSVLARQYTTGNVMLQEDVLYTTSSGADLPETEISFDPLGDNGILLDYETDLIELAVRHDGSAAARNTAWQMRVELYEGWAAPIRGRAGGYLSVVDNSGNRPEELDGFAGGMLEYFGAFHEPLQEGAHPKGLKLPVRAGQMYALACTLEPQGLEDGSNLWSAGFYGSEGELVQQLTPFVHFLDSGGNNYDSIGTTQEPVRWAQVHLAPSSAAFFQITGSRLGRGRLRLWKMQWEKGSSATAYDPGVSEEDVTGEWGYTEVAIDMGFAGRDEASGPAHQLRNLNEMAGSPELELVGEGILGYTVRSGPTKDGPWSDPVDDIEDLLITETNPWVLVRVRLGAQS